MPYPDNLLSRGERVVLHKHPHWKVLVVPAVCFVVIIGGGFALAAVLRSWEHHVTAWIVIAAVGVVGLVFLVLVPFLRWRTEHFVLTNHHVFFRTGIIRRREHQIPLGQIANLEVAVSFWGRILGFGTLIVESAADQPLEFTNVAALPTVQATLNQLIRDERQELHGGRHDRDRGDRYAEDDRDRYAPRDRGGRADEWADDGPAPDAHDQHHDSADHAGDGWDAGRTGSTRLDSAPGYSDRRRNRPARG